MSRTTEETGGAGASLLDGTLDTTLTPEHCDLDHWFAAAGLRYGRQVHGHAPERSMPPHMMEPGPLRSAILDEFAFRHCAEVAATQGIAYIVRSAPTLEEMDFYATQLLDEARHAYAFRWHLIELGLPRDAIAGEIERLVGEKRRSVIAPLEAFGLERGRSGDYLGSVIVLAVIAEGALAPAAEMSERKWRVLDPPAADVAEGANADEVRHLAVASSIIRRHLQRRSEDREPLAELIQRGMMLWSQLPMLDVLAEREQLFQKGLEQHRDLLGGYEIAPGRPLGETSAEERLQLQFEWSARMRNERLAYMGLPVS